jgi:hypothetical protein
MPAALSEAASPSATLASAESCAPLSSTLAMLLVRRLNRHQFSGHIRAVFGDNFRSLQVTMPETTRPLSARQESLFLLATESIKIDSYRLRGFLQRRDRGS